MSGIVSAVGGMGMVVIVDEKGVDFFAMVDIDVDVGVGFGSPF